MKKVKNILNNRRAIFIFGGIILLLVGVSGYAWWSIAYWDGYSARQQTLHQATKQQVDAVMTLKTETKEQRNEKVNALKEIASGLSVYDSLCRINVSVGWQQVLGDLRHREVACKEVQTQFSIFRRQLDLIVRYLEYERRLSEVLAIVPSGGEVAEGDFEKKLESWKAVKTALDNLKTDTEFSSVKQKAQESATANVNAWQELITSHRAKDKQKYLQAVKSLAAAHDTLSSITKADEEKLHSLASSLDDVAKRANL